jgi:protein-disulfide isomerase
MMRYKFPFIAVLLFSVLLAGQTMQTLGSQKPALDKQRIENYLRNMELFDPNYQVTIGDLQPSLFPDFYEIPVEVRTPRMTAALRYFLSKDGQHLIKGNIFDLNKKPFQDVLSKLTTDLQPSFGSTTAPVQIVVFADFQCPICKQEAKLLRQQIPAKYPIQVQVYFKDFPWVNEHKWAKAAAMAGRCIFKQQSAAFWEYHDWIYDHQDQLTAENFSDKLSEFAKTGSLDQEKLQRCVATKATEAEVDRSLAEAHTLQVNRTPTLFINGRELSGGVAWETIEKAIQRELAEKPKDLSSAPCTVVSDGCSAWPAK